MVLVVFSSLFICSFIHSLTIVWWLTILLYLDIFCHLLQLHRQSFFHFFVQCHPFTNCPRYLWSPYLPTLSMQVVDWSISTCHSFQCAVISKLQKWKKKTNLAFLSTVYHIYNVPVPNSEMGKLDSCPGPHELGEVHKSSHISWLLQKLFVWTLSTLRWRCRRELPRRALLPSGTDCRLGLTVDPPNILSIGRI